MSEPTPAEIARGWRNALVTRTFGDLTVTHTFRETITPNGDGTYQITRQTGVHELTLTTPHIADTDDHHTQDTLCARCPDAIGQNPHLSDDDGALIHAACPPIRRPTDSTGYRAVMARLRPLPEDPMSAVPR